MFRGEFPPNLGSHDVFIHLMTCRCYSVTTSCPTLCEPVDCSTPGFPVYHQLPEFVQVHVHRVGDAVHPSHPLPFFSPFAFN